MHDHNLSRRPLPRRAALYLLAGLVLGLNGCGPGTDTQQSTTRPSPSRGAGPVRPVEEEEATTPRRKQMPREEEEVDPVKPRKKVIVEDDEPVRPPVKEDEKPGKPGPKGR